ncbi:MAG: hypothetical protein IIC73_02735 [Armatimonadetes bacterium]|nr:hypothetical protein [Armatimonadota bacterium]
MPTKDALIDSIDYKDVTPTDVSFTVADQTYTIPGAIGVAVRAGVAFVTCHLKPKDLYSLSSSGKATKLRGAVSNEAWLAFNPPPAELAMAKRAVGRLDVPRGYEWSIIEGVPQLVPLEGGGPSVKKKRTLDQSKYPIGMKVTYMKGTPGKTTPGDTGEVVGYEDNRLVIQYQKKGKVVAQPGSRHKVSLH